jgi:hypothetical protein
MKFLDSTGGRKFTGFVVVMIMSFVGLWFGKLDSSAFQTLQIAALGLYITGNLVDYRINKNGDNSIGGKKK